ncbi:MAG: hypothetical protein QXN23_01695 [Candidatus Caldarchaeum sp.]
MATEGGYISIESRITRGRTYLDIETGSGFALPEEYIPRTLDERG